MKEIQNHIKKHLHGEMRKTALSFVEYLKENNATFYKDTCDCWRDKIYYWVKIDKECVCFIAIADPDEPGKLWTVWSEDSNVYASESVKEDIKAIAWKHIDYCGNCGSCGGGKKKTIFGKTFNKVCGCTFRIDNATEEDLPFLKKMVEMRIIEIINSDI